MRDFKCRMCGGELHIADDKATIAECEYCGSKMTLPSAEDSDQIRSAYVRADEYRRACDFDKAITAYERILAIKPDDPEAHWGIVLSRYGIEYVEDPTTKKRVPTCHRLQRVPITTDSDYLKAVENANSEEARSLYQEQATEILSIQKKILEIAESEEPCDVFISFKDKDENGKRTIDSVRAQEIYNNLTDKGYRVFFSRISLEDKIGEYEPYIFSALMTARVMIVIGTKAEYFNAVWVRNEWSRFIALIKEDRNRKIIPCYANMDPYDMPEELSLFQSYDMTRIGFIEDLVRGIGKVIPKDKKITKQNEATMSDSTQMYYRVDTALSNALKRGDILLSIGNFEEADKCFADALNLDPECVNGYIGRLLCNEKCRTREELASKVFDEKNANYILACKFAKGEDREFLQNISTGENHKRYLISEFKHSISPEEATSLLVKYYQNKYKNFSVSIDKRALQSQYIDLVDSTLNGYIDSYIIPNIDAVSGQSNEAVLSAWKNGFNQSWVEYAKTTRLGKACEALFKQEIVYATKKNRIKLFKILLIIGIILLAYHGVGIFLIGLAFFIRFPKQCLKILAVLLVLGVIVAVNNLR